MRAGVRGKLGLPGEGLVWVLSCQPSSGRVVRLRAEPHATNPLSSSDALTVHRSLICLLHLVLGHTAYLSDREYTVPRALLRPSPNKAQYAALHGYTYIDASDLLDSEPGGVVL